MRQITAVLLLVGMVLISGCGRMDHEASVKQRTQELIGYLCTDDFDGCLQLSDPIFVRAQGKEGVRVRFKILSALIKLGKLTPDKVRVDSIKIADDRKGAEVIASVLSNNNEWKSLQPIRWVFSDGQWYLAF